MFKKLFVFLLLPLIFALSAQVYASTSDWYWRYNTPEFQNHLSLVSSFNARSELPENNFQSYIKDENYTKVYDIIVISLGKLSNIKDSLDVFIAKYSLSLSSTELSYILNLKTIIENQISEYKKMKQKMIISIAQQQNPTVLDSEFQKAVLRMYKNGLTKYSDINSFRWDDYLTREQASKFFVDFAKEVLEKNIYSVNKITFKDIESVDPTLKDFVITAWQIWLFKWTNWYFLPQNNLTIGQTLSVIIRSSPYGVLDESSNPRYTSYYNVANWIYNILDGLNYNFNNMDSNILRKDVAVLLYRAWAAYGQESIMTYLCQLEYWEGSCSFGAGCFGIKNNGCFCKTWYKWIDSGQLQCIKE